MSLCMQRNTARTTSIMCDDEGIGGSAVTQPRCFKEAK